jgi:uncharacterized protein
MFRVVIDTNVVVSGLLRPKGAPATILDSAIAQRFRFFVSEPLMEEYREVLARDYLHLDQSRAARFIKALREVAMPVVPRKKIAVAPDPDDNLVIECAVEAGADFVVTGNVRHFPLQFHGVRVVTPRDFLVVLGSSPKPF